jgi:O-antigen ligase
MGVFAAFSPDLLAQSEFGRLNLDGATTIGTARVFGAGVVAAAILALAGRRWRGWWALAAGSLMALTIAVGSRGPVISVLIAVSAALLLTKTVAKRRMWAIAQLLIAVGLMVYSAVVSPSAASDRVRLFLAGDETDVARQFLFSEAWRQITRAPLGIGWGGFGVTHSFDKVYAGQATYPHNIFLEIAVEGGWIAVLCFLAIAILALRGLVLASTTPESAALLGLGVYWLAVAQTSSDVNGNRLTWIVLALGLISRAREASGAGALKVQAD